MYRRWVSQVLYMKCLWCVLSLCYVYISFTTNISFTHDYYYVLAHSLYFCLSSISSSHSTCSEHYIRRRLCKKREINVYWGIAELLLRHVETKTNHMRLIWENENLFKLFPKSFFLGVFLIPWTLTAHRKNIGKKYRRSRH
jgi:hypothetical protein